MDMSNDVDPVVEELLLFGTARELTRNKPRQRKAIEAAIAEGYAVPDIALMLGVDRKYVYQLAPQSGAKK